MKIIKIVKTILLNFLLTLTFLYFSTSIIIFIIWKKQTVQETDLLGIIVLNLLGTMFSVFIFMVIHLLISLLKNNIFDLKINKILIIIPLVSIIIIEKFDFRWWGIIKNIDLSYFTNYSLLCLIFILLYIIIISFINHRKNLQN